MVVVIICASCANHSLQSCFSRKEFFGECPNSFIFRHLNMDYITPPNDILKDLSKLSRSFTIKT